MPDYLTKQEVIDLLAPQYLHRDTARAALDALAVYGVNPDALVLRENVPNVTP